MVVFQLPMHTATRIAVSVANRVKQLNPQARIVRVGLYANSHHFPLDTALGAEFEADLVRLASGGAASGERAPFIVPDRTGLPSLARYAHFDPGNGEPARIAGYTEASRGCKHLCRHCPIVPEYGGRFRAVPAEVVLADITQQVTQGGARHITFGDPDFFNGPTHAVRIVERLAREFPGVSYDVTVKVEHLLRHRDLLPVLARTGCALITTAAESFDDRVLTLLAKGHTYAGFGEALGLCQAAGLPVAPTFIPFTPWTTRESYRFLLTEIARLGLVDAVAPVQLGLRLLIPGGSPLREFAGEWDPGAFTYRWHHPTDPWLDELPSRVIQTAAEPQPRRTAFQRIAEAAGIDDLPVLPSRATIPFLTEPWFC
jgi:hypothetical protein